MASKKKLRKRLKYYVSKIESYQANIIRQRNTINSLYENIGLLLEGTGKNRILQLRIPKTQKQIEDDVMIDKNNWGGYIPNANKTEIDGLKNRSGDELNIGDWVDVFPNPGGFPKKIVSFFVDPDERFPGIMALTDYGDSYNIDYLTPNIKYNELKKEEEEKEGAVPEAGQ